MKYNNIVKHRFIYHDTIRQLFEKKIIEVDGKTQSYSSLSTTDKIVAKIIVPDFDNPEIKKIVVNIIKSHIKIDKNNKYNIIGDYIIIAITSSTSSNINDAPACIKGNMIAESKNKIRLYKIIAGITKGLQEYYTNIASKYVKSCVDINILIDNELKHKAEIDKL